MKSFEDNIKELQKITAALENRETPLDKGLAEFERGTAIVEECVKQLSEYRGKITVMQKQLDNLIESAFDSND